MKTKEEIQVEMSEIRDEMANLSYGVKWMKFVDLFLASKQRVESYRKVYGADVKKASASVSCNKILKNETVARYVELHQQMDLIYAEEALERDVISHVRALKMLQLNAEKAQVEGNYAASNGALKEILAFHRWQMAREDELSKGNKEDELAEKIAKVYETPLFEDMPDIPATPPTDKNLH